ncbi:GIY-YIG nuclease family protein [Natranaerobius trueperi]|uniref:GIY-YIG domain-containing protein n=1 Tax=Natranaerobius trueperi TaxID=759412 RepID=A0A226C1S1_9FIRM|nr:GIY-YIG nuclease family protein [Natranaerobius trueperi]OWZ84320.1 hypothetical protein CDO51_03390 [Natranaerobius trueperi]
MFYVYILVCSDKTLYTGYTNNLESRIKKHNEGKASKYTRARLPVKLGYYEEYNSKSDAMKRESLIKKMNRNEKIELCNSYKS